MTSAPFRLRPLGLIALAALAAACADSPVDSPPPETLDLAEPWVSASPNAVSMDGTALDSATAAAARLDRMRSLVVVRRGHLILEEYFGGTDRSTPADVRSVTKSVVSLLSGIALERGDLARLDQPIGEILGPPQFQLTPEQAAISVRDLLTMTAGFQWGDEAEDIYNEWIVSDDHLAFLLGLPLETPAGTQFHYNSASTHLLGVVLEEAIGTPLPTFADQVLFEPLGIQERVWESLTDGRVNGGSGIDLRPVDLARLGQLMLQEGWSGSRPVLPSVWVREATRPRFAWTTDVGPVQSATYGYLWWVDLDRDAYFAWGFGGQFVYVHPGEQLVVVATTNWRGVRADGGPGSLEDAVMGIVIEGVLGAVR